MATKLTLRMEERLIRRAKREASRRGKSLSRMVAEYFDAVTGVAPPRTPDPPVTAALRGLLKGKAVSEEDYRRHLVRKHR